MSASPVTYRGVTVYRRDPAVQALAQMSDDEVAAGRALGQRLVEFKRRRRAVPSRRRRRSGRRVAASCSKIQQPAPIITVAIDRPAAVSRYRFQTPDPLLRNCFKPNCGYSATAAPGRNGGANWRSSPYPRYFDAARRIGLVATDCG